MIRFRIVKRKPLPGWAKIVIPIAAILVTLILSAIPILLAGGHLWKSYFYLFYGALGTRFNFLETFVKASPLLLTGLAVAFAFRAKFWNIGAEGQFLLGAMAAVFIGTQESLPTWSLVPLMILCGFIAGGLWAVLPAILKTRFKVDDVVTTLLLNFIVFYAMMALLDGVWKDPLSGYPDSPDILMDAEYPILLRATRLHLGVLLAAFPESVVDLLGVPASSTKFYPSILGAVLIGIAVALVIEYVRRPTRPAGLGLCGAIAINLCGAVFLIGWLFCGGWRSLCEGRCFCGPLLASCL